MVPQHGHGSCSTPSPAHTGFIDAGTGAKVGTAGGVCVAVCWVVWAVFCIRQIASQPVYCLSSGRICIGSGAVIRPPWVYDEQQCMMSCVTASACRAVSLHPGLALHACMPLAACLAVLLQSTRLAGRLPAMKGINAVRQSPMP